MIDIRSDEAFRIWLINYLSEKFGEHAILKGGMVLRLLNSQRSTNDLDYVFVPYRFKKDIVPLLEKVFEGMEGITLTYQLHSTNARFLLNLKNDFGLFKAKLEVNVSDACPYQPLSTSEVSLQYQQLPHIVCVMKLDTALAHKLAAWNERGLMRDIYDAYFFYKFLNILPDRETLEKRLQKINYSRGKRNLGPKKLSLEEFLNHLETELHQVTDSQLQRELGDYFKPEELVGLDLKIKSALNQMIERLKE